MKNVSPAEPQKGAKKLPPPPVPGGPAISVPIAQCEEWQKRHGLKIIGCDVSARSAPNTWPPTFYVIRENS